MLLSANDMEDLYHSNLYINVATMQVKTKMGKRSESLGYSDFNFDFISNTEQKLKKVCLKRSFKII